MTTLDKPNKDSTTPFRVMPDQSTDYRIVVLGSAGVGKTNCVLRFVHGQFRENYIPTVEDTYRQVVSCNKQITTLQITDTTGAHQFPAMQRLSIQKGHAFILAYSITSKQTFEDLKPIYQQIREIKGEQLSETPILLMGCKFDDTTCREVAESLGKQLANHWSCAWIETSAKTNLNICEAFQELLKLDKKRQFNFNVDQDGHLIEDGGSTTSISVSSSPHGGKRLTVHGFNTNPFSTSNSSNLNENHGNNNSSTKSPTLNSNFSRAGRTSIHSNSSTPSQSSKKGHRTISDQQDLNRSKKTSSSDSSSTRKCRVM